MTQIPGIPVSIVVISKEQRDCYLFHDCNTQTRSQECEDAFLKDACDASNRLRTAVEAHWTHWTPGPSPFVMGEDDAVSGLGATEKGEFFIADEVASRFLCIEVLSEAILTPQLLRVVHELVVTLPTDYSVDICNDFVGLTTEDGQPYPGFDIFVERSRILVYTESTELLKKLGVSD